MWSSYKPQSELKETARIRRHYVLSEFRKKTNTKKLIEYLLNYTKSC